MKKDFKGFLVGASTMAVLMGGLTFATNRIETVERIFRDIKIKLNGTEITPKDATGKVVEPFIIDGTTYLPVRAVGEAMGLDVDWNNDTSTVILDSSIDWEKPNRISDLLYQNNINLNSFTKEDNMRDVVLGSFTLKGKKCEVIATVRYAESGLMNSEGGSVSDIKLKNSQNTVTLLQTGRESENGYEYAQLGDLSNASIQIYHDYIIILSADFEGDRLNIYDSNGKQVYGPVEISDLSLVSNNEGLGWKIYYKTFRGTEGWIDCLHELTIDDKGGAHVIDYYASDAQ